MTEQSASIMQGNRRATVLALAAVLCWSTVASAFKLSLQYLSPLQLVTIASVVSTLFMFAVICWQRRLPELRTSWRANYKWYLALGFCNPFLYYLVLFNAYALLPAQQAQPLNYTWGVVLALLSVPLLKQKLRRQDLLAGLVCYIGVLVIATKGDPFSLQFDQPFGVALALFSTVIWSCYWLLNTRIGGNAAVNLLLTFCCGLPWLFAAVMWQGGWQSPPVEGWLGALYVGLFEMGIAFLLWQGALLSCDNTARISNFIYLSPPLSLLLIALLVGESIHVATIAGLGLILLGVAIQQGALRHLLFRWQASR
ncbi:DMT family transporter [Microbulbifer harenosus]|uniref:DMT family transporter n=2 Tax=Microbulbifer TaxID=48073 RepID=A0ABY2UMH4_9GAMM|nr:DMT family transporter [Microbulbifer harenosus]QIL89008.1 EamA family transporter [Microbulbifer sp. SH-1]TLM77742.1 DMT family transporter [Microbulbifer harenosus]